MGSQDDWHFVLGQLTRAGISVPDGFLRYQRQDPSAERQGGARIVASPGVRVAVPGTSITYTLAHGARGVHSRSAPYRYQWYVLNDPVTSRLLGKPARVEGWSRRPDRGHGALSGQPQGHLQGGPPGRRRRQGAGRLRVPADRGARGPTRPGRLAASAGSERPAQQLELPQTFLHVLREAEKQPGSAPLDPGTAQSYEKHIATLLERMASTEGAERELLLHEPIHVDQQRLGLVGLGLQDF
jgi:Bacterial toxin 3